MPGSAGTGQPGDFQCSACRRRKPWSSERRYDPNRLWDKGLILHVTLTGKSKAIGDGRASGRSTNTRFQYKCDDCGHVGWSRHIQIFDKALREGVPTPGEDGPVGRATRRKRA